jgi:hypothetical protein
MPSPLDAPHYAHFAAATGRHSQSLAPKRYALMLWPLPIASAAIRSPHAVTRASSVGPGEGSVSGYGARAPRCPGIHD